MADVATLGPIVADWIRRWCVIPDRDERGQAFILTAEQERFLDHFYAVDLETRTWVYRRGAQLIRPQKAGKGPFAAAVVCAEAVGPVLPVWERGELVGGQPWATPHIQITACSEDQTDNTWRALQPMIELGPLSDEVITDSGLTRINLPGGGIIEPVTASARSRLGQRISFAVEDETHGWVQSNHGWWLADNQRRNLAGVGGRFLETTNAWDPAEQSVAQRTYEARDPHVFRDYKEPPHGSVRNQRERRKVMRHVYGDALIEKGGWVDLDRIDVEVEALLEHDPAQAERFFLNRLIASEGSAFDIVKWQKLAKPAKPALHELITIGVDGAKFDDAVAAVACHVKSGYTWPLHIIERPPGAPDDYEHPLRELEQAVDEAFSRFIVWRAYCDPHHLEDIVERWQNRYGDKVVIPWYTYRPRQIAWAVRNFTEAISTGQVMHPGDGLFTSHIRHARKKKLTVLDDREQQMHTLSKDSFRSPRKIDAAMAAVLAWEARGDCIAAGAVHLGPDTKEPPPKRELSVLERLQRGMEIHSNLVHPPPEKNTGPMGDMS